MTLGHFLKSRRIKKKKTIRDVIKETGVTGIHHYESEKNEPTFCSVVKIAKCLDIDLSDLAKLV